MSESSLRVRVKEIRESDPAFFEKMENWRDEYKARRKRGSPHYFLDTRWEQKYVSLAGRISKRPFLIEDALEFLWWKWQEDEGVLV